MGEFAFQQAQVHEIASRFGLIATNIDHISGRLRGDNDARFDCIGDGTMKHSRKIEKKLAIDMTPPLTGISGDALVRTPCGPRRAESLRTGDLVVTRDNGLQPISLIWKRQADPADLISKPSNAPVRLNARAIGPMMPQRPITVAPAHGILVPGYLLADEKAVVGGLLPARALAGSTDSAFFDRDASDDVFYNFVFSRHEIFWASGLQVESFQPEAAIVGRIDLGFREDLIRHFPALKRKADPFPKMEYPKVKAKDYMPSVA
jgi:hypothetical protein